MISMTGRMLHAIIRAVALLLVFSVVKYYLQRRRYFQLGNNLPGPKCWSIASEFFRSPSDILLVTLRKLATKYPMAAIWLGPQLSVIVNGANLAEKFFTTPSLITRDVRIFKRSLGNGLLTINGAQWKQARKAIEPTFHSSFLKHFIGVFQSHSARLCERLQTEIGKPPFDIYTYLKNSTFDLVADTALQINYDSRNEKAKDILQYVERQMELTAKRYCQFWHHSDFIYQFSNDARECDTINALARSITKEELERKKDEALQKVARGGRSSFFVPLLEKYDIEEVADHMITLLVAGYDTTASTLGFMLVMLATHPEIQERVYQEAAEVYGALPDGKLGAEDIDKLQNLEMVIKETLRLFPAVPLTSRKVKEEFMMEGKVIPAGATMNMNIFETHRDANLYEHPDQFDPDNFLPENISKRHSYSYIPFGHGPRTCVGYRFALWSLKVIASSILLHYKLECDYKMEDIEIDWHIVLKMKNGFNLRLLKRE